MTDIAAVTGASRGIGRATTLELARRGYRVLALARSQSDLQDVAAAAHSSGHEVVTIVMDIGDESSRHEAITTVINETGGHGLDLLVNNAGYGQIGPLEEVTVERLRQQFEVNLFGLHDFSRPFIAGMRQRGHGSIINVSSVSGRGAAPFSGAYAASKSALESMSDALRLELRPFGVYVILIEPGPIRTAFGDVSRTTTDRDPGSPYAPFIDRFEARRKGWYLFEKPAESVAAVIAQAAQSRHPRARYTVTIPARATNIARRLVPDGVMDWLMRRAIGE